MSESTPDFEQVIGQGAVKFGPSAQATPATASESQAVQPSTPEGLQFSLQEGAVASVGILFSVATWHFVSQSLKRRNALTDYLPCIRCHYFKANMYLPCAVNPMVALKPEAKDCMEFRAHGGN